jgi:hypothetical protein
MKGFITEIRTKFVAEPKPFRILLKDTTFNLIAAAETEEEIMKLWKWIQDNLMEKITVSQPRYSLSFSSLFFYQSSG